MIWNLTKIDKENSHFWCPLCHMCIIETGSYVWYSFVIHDFINDLIVYFNLDLLSPLTELYMQFMLNFKLSRVPATTESIF